MKRHFVASALGAIMFVGATEAKAYCPSYTASSASNNKGCAIEAALGKNPTTAEWQGIFDLVAKGPSVWGSQGPAASDITQGCGSPMAPTKIQPEFPCQLLKAIAMAESGWKQFCEPESPPDQKGKSERTIISFDCGYGVGQVTSGMRVKDPTPNYDQQRVASDATYNLATGTQILASKWRYTKCVGDRQPRVVEHWYTATWAYNGLAWSNNPNNPSRDPGRGVYDPKVGGSYTYQEKVFGRIEHPPSSSYWQSVPLAYPDRMECGSSGSPPALTEPKCASPTDCTNTRGVHESSCFGGNGTGGSGGSAGSAGAGGGSAGAGDAAGSAGSAAAGAAGSGGSPGTGGGRSPGTGGGRSAGAGGTEPAANPSDPQEQRLRVSSGTQASCVLGRLGGGSSPLSPPAVVAWLLAGLCLRRGARQEDLDHSGRA